MSATVAGAIAFQDLFLMEAQRFRGRFPGYSNKPAFPRETMSMIYASTSGSFGKGR